MTSSVIAEYFSQLDDAELVAWLRALDTLVSDARQARQAARTGWYVVLRSIGEAEQRWRQGGTAPLTSWESELVNAAQALSAGELRELHAHNLAIFEGENEIPFKHPAAMIAGVCAIVLDMVRESRHPKPAA